LAKYRNIEEYRAKKKQKSILKKILSVIGVLLILVVLLNVIELFKGNSLDKILSKKPIDSSSKFPIIIKKEQLIGMYNMGFDFCVLTKAGVISYSDSGEKIISLTHGYTNPVTRQGSKRILTYDRGGNSFRVDSSTKALGEKKLENKIKFAQISSNGNVVVVTNHNRFASIVTVYDKDFDEIYEYSSNENIISICFSPNQNYLLATSITTQNNMVSTKLLQLNLKDETDINTYTIKDILPLEVSYNENEKINIIGKNKLVTYDTKTLKESTFEFQGKLVSYTKSSDSSSVIVIDSLVNDNSIISVINGNAELTSTYELEDKAIDLYSDGSRVMVLGKKFAYNFNMSLQILNKYELEKSYNKVIYNGESLYLMSDDSVRHLKLD